MSMNNPDWQRIREQANLLPEGAFEFVREGLSHTVKAIHGDGEQATGTARSRHVSGQQLCLGLRDYALDKYGMLAGAVMRKWGIRKTDDFGMIVYCMIDRGEMRASPEDNLDDFKGVFDFEEAFSFEVLRGA